MKIQQYIFYGFIISCLLGGGCDSKQKLTGKVTFSDGEVLTVGTVVFSTPDFISRSFIKPDGTFNVGTYKAGDGIPPGTYKVFVIEAFESDPHDPSGDSLNPLVAKEFTTAETTPLSITIPGNKTFDFAVERAPPLKHSTLPSKRHQLKNSPSNLYPEAISVPKSAKEGSPEEK
ncbi:MAG: hypothetical protein FWE67_12080 [Planctomycetaceae bacterium]|nr:hypothetical protein [Planctomycetaceae bacterium]